MITKLTLLPGVRLLFLFILSFSPLFLHPEKAPPSPYAICSFISGDIQIENHKSKGKELPLFTLFNGDTRLIATGKARVVIAYFSGDIYTVSGPFILELTKERVKAKKGVVKHTNDPELLPKLAGMLLPPETETAAGAIRVREKAVPETDSADISWAGDTGNGGLAVPAAGEELDKLIQQKYQETKQVFYLLLLANIHSNSNHKEKARELVSRAEISYPENKAIKGLAKSLASTE